MNVSVRITGEIFTKQRYGGVSRYCVELARELNQLNSVNAVVDVNPHINEYLYLARGELKHRGVYLRSDAVNLKRVCRGIQSARSAFPPTGRHAIIHASYYGFENFRKTALANVCTFYDMIHERYKPDPRFNQRKRQALGRADRCIAISQATKEDMVHYLDADPDRIDVIYLASRITPTLTPPPVEGDYLLWVGARSWYKNFDCFVSAFARSRVASEGLMVVCAGGPAFTQHERELWHQHGLSPQQLRHLQPSDTDLAGLYSGAKALVYASLYEGFGIPPLEAMMCDCPVIASSAGSLPEVVGDAALMVVPDSPESIADQVDSLLFSSTAANELRERGRRQAAKFSWKRCAEETHASYLRALSEREGSQAVA